MRRRCQLQARNFAAMRCRILPYALTCGPIRVRVCRLPGRLFDWWRAHTLMLGKERDALE
jgi:hypothetical protein